MSDNRQPSAGSPADSLVDGLLVLTGLELDEARADALRAALRGGSGVLADLRAAAAGEEPVVVFDPRWD